MILALAVRLYPVKLQRLRLAVRTHNDTMTAITTLHAVEEERIAVDHLAARTLTPVAMIAHALAMSGTGDVIGIGTAVAATAEAATGTACRLSARGTPGTTSTRGADPRPRGISGTAGASGIATVVVAAAAEATATTRLTTIVLMRRCVDLGATPTLIAVAAMTMVIRVRRGMLATATATPETIDAAVATLTRSCSPKRGITGCSGRRAPQC